MRELQPGDRVSLGGSSVQQPRIVAIDEGMAWCKTDNGVRYEWPLIRLILIPETVTVTLNLEDAQGYSEMWNGIDRLQGTRTIPIVIAILAALSEREAK